MPPNATTAKAAGHAARAGDKALEQCGNVATNSDVAAGMGSDEVGESEEPAPMVAARATARLASEDRDQIARAGPAGKGRPEDRRIGGSGGEWGQRRALQVPTATPPLLTG